MDRLIVTGARVALALGGIALLVLLLGPFGGLEHRFGFTDKEAHVSAFYLLCMTALAATPRLRALDVLIVCIAFGGATEVLQALVGRDCELGDFIADGLGCTLAWIPVRIARARQGGAPGGQRDRRRRMLTGVVVLDPFGETV